MRGVTAAILLAVILMRVGRTGLPALPIGAAAVAMPMVAALLVAGQCVAALRWRVVIGAGALPWRYLARLYLVGGFFSLFLPTLVGGDAFRAAAVARELPPGRAVASVLLDRIVGITALGAYGALGLLLAPATASAMIAGARWARPGPGAVALLAVALVLGVGAIAAVPAARHVAAQMRDAAVSLALAPRAIALALLLGLVVQGIYIVAWMLAAAALDTHLAATVFLLAVPLVTLGGMLPVSIAGLGLREGAWLFLLRSSGIAPARVVAFSVLFFAGTVLAGAVGGLLFAARGTTRAGRPGGEAAVR